MCADDFGISPGVDEGILCLALGGKISAISCLTVYPEWKSSARALSKLKGSLDIGLHLSGDEDLERQYLDFQDGLGMDPDFIDGHRHIHQDPFRSKQMVELLKKSRRPPYTRNTFVSPGVIFRQGISRPKTAALSFAGYFWKQRALRHGISTNDGFTGVYDFREKSEEELLQIFSNFATYLSGKRPLWMVHPGMRDKVLAKRDAFTRGRYAELRLLKSSFLADQGIQCARFATLERANPTSALCSTIGGNLSPQGIR